MEFIQWQDDNDTVEELNVNNSNNDYELELIQWQDEKGAAESLNTDNTNNDYELDFEDETTSNKIKWKSSN